MAADVITISITSTDQSDKKQVTNVNYINPATPNAILREFAEKLIALTDDTYVSTKKITKGDVI